MKEKIRESNIELLRLLCMLMILVNHLVGHGVLLDNTVSVTPVESLFRCLGAALWTPAALVFVLISGYFGIRPSVRGIAKYSFVCTFYLLLCGVVGG